MTRFQTLLAASFLACAAVGGTPMAAQENLFAARIIINDRAITEYEYQQRRLFMQLLGAPGDLDKLALDGLIEDRLRQQEAEFLDVKLEEKGLRDGMEEFAQRANMSADEFIKVLAQAGIAAETFRDFVAAGVVWREIVRARFGQSASVSEAEIDRVIEGETRRMALNVAVSELIIPAPEGQEQAVVALARRIQAEVKTEAGFAAAVAQHSAAASRERGGRLDTMPINRLPPVIAGVIQGLQPGQVSAPVVIPGAVALFQLRGQTEVKPEDALPVQVEYARLRLPATPESAAEMNRILTRSDNCKDLYGTAPGLPEDQLKIETSPMSALPADLGLELARLDPGESVLRNLGAVQEAVMLCTRSPLSENPVDRGAIRSRLLNAKLEKKSEMYLATLRANAIIRQP